MEAKMQGDGQGALLHAEESRERDYSSLTNDELIGYVFSSDGTWYAEADREMHRRLLAGRADMLAGRRASDAWGALVIKIVTLIVHRSMRNAQQDIEASKHEIADLVGEFVLQLAKEGGWMAYNGSGKLVGYLVNKNGPLLAALKRVVDPRRKISKKDIPIKTTGDIVKEEEHLGERQEGVPEVDVDVLKNVNTLLRDYQAKMAAGGDFPEREDFKKISQLLYSQVARADPNGARIYCMFTYGCESINVGKFGDEEYQQMLMGSCGLKDQVIARLMHKSVGAVTQARSRFQEKMRTYGEAFLKRDALGASTGGYARIKG